uniref:NAD(+) diphosphatase n=1 Tax=Leptobrachium leishanense TaxID=445787 RepID=A0A8C5QDT3_9ANUR
MFRGILNIHLIASTCTRRCSSYVKHTRYLFDLKENDEACRQALKSGSFYLFHNLLPLVRKSDAHFSAPVISAQELQQTLRRHGQDEQKIEDSVLLSCSQSSNAEFALDLGWMEKGSLEKDYDGTFTNLAKTLVLLDGRNGPVLAQAQALLRWHETHQFCGKTGQPTEKNLSGSKRVCSTNGMVYYPQMCPVVITLVSYKNHCLLARQESFPAGMYTALSGFCDIGETLEETVRREVAEEVGLQVESVRYFGSQHWPFPSSSLMVGCHATVQHNKINVNRSELEDARWLSLEETEEALQRNILLKPENGIVPVWLPPTWTIAHTLIHAWTQKQKAHSNGE